MSYDASLDRDRYWATETDPEVLIDACKDRFKCYAEVLETTHFTDRLRRQWRYYHNLYYGAVSGSMEIKSLGEKGELAGLSINHFRNFIQHVMAMVTEARVDFEAQARNADQASLDATRLAKALADDYRDHGNVHRAMLRMLEHAMVMTEGYIWICWDETKGERLAIDEDEQGQPRGYIHEGDVVCKNPTLFDVARDVHVRDHERNQWVIVRDYINRHDAVAMWPNQREEILSQECEAGGDAGGETWKYESLGVKYEKTDQISIYTLIHEPCPALPNGKYFRYIGDAALDPTDRPLETGRLDIYRMVPAEVLLTSMGYSPAADLQGPQEAYNGETSAITTNHKTFGVQNIWVESSDTVTTKELEGALNLVQSRTKPEALNLAQTPGEMFQFRQQLLLDMGQLIGVNQTRRGFPEKSVHSGTALALLDAQSQQFNTPLADAWISTYEQVMTAHIRLVDAFMPTGHAREIAVMGRLRKPSRVVLKKGSLELVNRVKIRRGNALTRTTAGRVELANMMISNGLVRTPEELLNVIETGQIETLVEAERAQLEIIHDENEILMHSMEQQVAAMHTDNHVLHIREHSALMNTTEVRMTPYLNARILAHMMHHIQLMATPESAIFQTILGHAPAAAMGQALMGAPGAMAGGMDERRAEDGKDVPAGVRPPQKPRVPERQALGAA